MKKAIVLVLVTALVTAVVCYFSMKPKMLPRVARLTIDSPDREYVAVVVTDDWQYHGVRTVVQSVHLVRKNEADQPPVIEPGAEIGFRGTSIATVHSCENSDIDVHWTDARSVVIRYSQTQPDWISFVKISAGVAVFIEEKAIGPNQALQPTPMLVTPRADARVAPSTGVADL